MHILHTHSHEGFFALIATLAHAIWRAIVLIIVGIYRYRTGTVSTTVPVLSEYVQPRIPVPYATIRTVRYGTHSNFRVKLCAYNGAYTCPLHGHHSVRDDTL